MSSAGQYLVFDSSDLSTYPKTAQSAEMHQQNFVTSRPNHAEGVYGIKAKPCMEFATCCGMESSRSDAWNQSEGKIHAIA